MARQMLTFEYETDHIEIHGDEAGLRYLIARLEELLESAAASRADNLQLLTREWGGNELSSETQGKGSLIDQVVILCHRDTSPERRRAI